MIKIAAQHLKCCLFKICYMILALIVLGISLLYVGYGVGLAVYLNNFPVSDNVHSHHQKAVFHHFQTLLDSGAKTYSLWKELEGTIRKGVFRRLRIPEPFPEQRTHRPERHRVAPYVRPVPESLNTAPLFKQRRKNAARGSDEGSSLTYGGHRSSVEGGRGS